MRSRREQDAAEKVERPTPHHGAGGGTAEDEVLGRQTRPAHTEYERSTEKMSLIEQAVQRDNLLKALDRVVSNGGASKE